MTGSPGLPARTHTALGHMQATAWSSFVLCAAAALIIGTQLLVAPQIYANRAIPLLGLLIIVGSAVASVVRRRLTERSLHVVAGGMVLGGNMALWVAEEPLVTATAAGWNLLIVVLVAWAGSPRAAAVWAVACTAVAFVDVLRLPGEREAVRYAAAQTLGLVGLASLVYLLLRRALDRALERARQLATRDELTGLLNRRGMRESLPLLSGRAYQERGLAVLVCDLDRFKRVNDDLGHTVGDRVLRRVADTLHDQLRPDDLVVRFGGEEIAVLVRVPGEADAMALAERLRAAVARACAEWDVTMSVGVAVAGPGADPVEHVERLFAEADANMYRAKESGRNRVAGPARSPSAV